MLPLLLVSFWHVASLFDSEAHRAVSMGSPSQAAANGAFLQWRSLYLLPLPQEADGSHSDHSPQSDQASEPGKRTTIMNVSKVNREGAQGDNYNMIKHVEKTNIMSSSKLKHKTFKQASHPETATIFLGLS